MKEIIITLFTSLIICGAIVWEARLLDTQASVVIAETLSAPPPIFIKYPSKTDVSSALVEKALKPAKKIIKPVFINTNVPDVTAPDTAKTPSQTSVNLAVPFVSQAPFKVWDAIHEETCEEADMIMVDKYFKKEKTINLAEADQLMNKIIEWEKVNLGRYEDTNADEIARTLREFFGYKNVRLVYDPTVADLKEILAKGFPILVPADGKQLLNPNFKHGGPPYHVVVLHGYDAKGNWITNDPGTRLGNGFLYPEKNLMTAMHDYVPGDTAHGQKVVVVVEPN